MKCATAGFFCVETASLFYHTEVTCVIFGGSHDIGMLYCVQYAAYIPEAKISELILDGSHNILEKCTRSTTKIADP